MLRVRVTYAELFSFVSFLFFVNASFCTQTSKLMDIDEAWQMISASAFILHMLSFGQSMNRGAVFNASFSNQQTDTVLYTDKVIRTNL